LSTAIRLPRRVAPSVNWSGGLVLAPVAVAYFAVAKLGLTFAAGNDIVSAVWPPSGVALAAVFVLGYRVWPAIAVGAFFANATGDSSAAVAAGIACGNALAAVSAGYMLSRARFDPHLGRIRDVVALALLGAAASTAVNATIGTSVLWIDGVASPGTLWEFWRVWWLGDLTGVLLVAPPLLLLAAGRGAPLPRARIAEASVLVAALVAVTIVVLNGRVTVAYPVFPLIILASMRFRQVGGVVAALVVSSLAVYFTAHGEGPFVGGSSAIELLRAQLFVAVAAVTALLVAAMRTEWERSEGALARLGESERALAEAQELAHIGSWEWDIASDRITWSPELYRIFDVDRSVVDLSYDAYMRLVHPDDRDRFDQMIRASVEQGTRFHVEHRAVRPDGEERILDCHGRLLRDARRGPIKLLGTAQDVTAQRLAEQRLEHLALHDPLTGLPNRALFLDRLEHALTLSQRPGSNLAVLFCDVDDFKDVNDGFGHEAGDELLTALPLRLREALRPGDTVARFGGDEFAILCEQLGSEMSAIAIAKRLTEAFSRPLEVGGRCYHVGISVGLVLVRGGEAKPGDVLRDADAAMYRAKTAGKNRYVLFDEGMRTHLVSRLQTEAELRRAVERQQLQLRFQPVYSLRDGELVGAEALLRWHHPERGLLPLAEFLDVAEASGTIVELGAWVLEEACARAAELSRDDGARRLRVSVNLSARQIADADLATLVAETLARTALDPSLLAVEITESALLGQSGAALQNLVRLRELGVGLVLDDFGTGYSSLSYLKRMPIDLLKIDREFVRGLGERDEDTAIVAAILSMAQSLGVETVAEGVETEEQLLWLCEHRCQFAQGHLLSPPLPSERLASSSAAAALSLGAAARPSRSGSA
jgi:diguanylate cyclase (GGDEF)-like protein/PAS domain S-box-containing protein